MMNRWHWLARLYICTILQGMSLLKQLQKAMVITTFSVYLGQGIPWKLSILNVHPTSRHQRHQASHLWSYPRFLLGQASHLLDTGIGLSYKEANLLQYQVIILPKRTIHLCHLLCSHPVYLRVYLLPQRFQVFYPQDLHQSQSGRHVLTAKHLRCRQYRRVCPPLYLPSIRVINLSLRQQVSQVQVHRNQDNPLLSRAYVHRNQKSLRTCLPLFLPYLQHYRVLSPQVPSIKVLDLVAFLLYQITICLIPQVKCRLYQRFQRTCLLPLKILHHLLRKDMLCKGENSILAKKAELY
mmetsp:Transcript_4547/g.7046  ORF Transcript_4547/g.7046 Transcript_4547/m.7046 type:complete len:295 (+) Transcript_4547:346-1230(+)